MIEVDHVSKAFSHKQAVDDLTTGPRSASFLMREAVPALDRAVTAYEKNLSMVLRQSYRGLGRRFAAVSRRQITSPVPVSVLSLRRRP